MIRRIAKKALWGIGAVLVVIAAWLLYVDVSDIPKYDVTVPELHVEVTPARVAQGKRFAGMLCADCHLNPSTGRLTGKHMTDAPQFGDIWSKNITQHPEKGIGNWSDGELALFLRTGLKKDGTFVPPWMPKMPHLSDEDLASIIAFLRSDDPLVAASDAVPGGVTKPSFLSKLLTHTVIEPFEYPKQTKVAPPATDRVAYGRYMTLALDCYSCHSADFVTIDWMHPEKSPGYLAGGNTVNDANGKPIHTANLTPDPETGIGKWSESDFVRAVKTGFRPDGRMLHYPMTPRVELTDEEAGAIYAYLRTVPAIHNEVVRTVDAPADGSDRGQRLYVSYGCVGCHGTTGEGPDGANLRKVNEHYPRNDALRAWIEDAPSKKRGTRMPAWKGIIKEEDYGPLMAYVRALARGENRSASR